MEALRLWQWCAHLRRKAQRWLPDLARKAARGHLVHGLDNVGDEHERPSEKRAGGHRSTAEYATAHLHTVEEMRPGSSRRDGHEAITGDAAKVHASPHLIRGPKEALRRLSCDGRKRPRYSNNDTRLRA